MIELKNHFKNQILFLQKLLSPHTKRAYLVGGCVRDALLGKKSSDFDVELYDFEPKKLQAFMSELGAKMVGKSFFVYKYKNYDFALARFESKIGIKHKDFEVRVCDNEYLGAKRRDFSMNALMFNIFSYELLDFYGGLEAIRKKNIVLINAKSFVEDELRVLRAIEFAARFGYKIEKNTLFLMQNMSIDFLSKMRIREELYKFFRAKHLALGLYYIIKLDLLDKLLEPVCIKYSFFKLLIKARKRVLDEGLFLFLFLNEFKIDKKSFFKKHKYKKELFLKANQPYFKTLDAFRLCEIALFMPLKQYLGLFREKDIKLAKALNIYENKLEFELDILALKKQGLNPRLLGQKIRRLKQIKIIKYIRKRKICEKL